MGCAPILPSVPVVTEDSQPAALSFLSNVQLQQRRVLAVYPIVLFYFVLAWIILISKSLI